MRLFATLMFICCSFQLRAQEDEVLSAKRLPLDSVINAAPVFNNELLACSPGFTFRFEDKESPNELKYLYEHTNHETLKIQYVYRNRTTEGSDQPKPLIFMQKIIAERGVIAQLYSCMFSRNINADQLEGVAGYGMGFMYHEKDYHYSLTPDDYKPGYWVLTITE